MCCFSRPVEHVSGTSIFVRGARGSQFLAYEMDFAASADLALVLPLPVPPGPPDDAVRFINLDGYRDIFEDLRRGFPAAAPVGAARADGPRSTMAPLAIHEVGSFEASFVPRMADFDRLDLRFRVSEHVWAKMPVYRDYGFAVFKLKASTQRSRMHPVALEFPRRDPSGLYFPTMHVHDGTVRDAAQFDHELYCQAGANQEALLEGWTCSTGRAEEFVDTERTVGLVDPARSCWQLRLAGRRENGDAWVRRAMRIPAPVD